MASKKGRPQPHPKPGHNGAYPDQPAKSSYKPNDPKHARNAKV